MEAKHTPGPWNVVEGSGFDYGSRSYWIPGVCTHVDDEPTARLIAAAPDLLEALVGLLDRYVQAIGNEGVECYVARAAIAKVTGEL